MRLFHSSRRQTHKDAVTDLKLPVVLWLFVGWHAEECITSDNPRINRAEPGPKRGG
jgi:hypothetical protein